MHHIFINTKHHIFIHTKTEDCTSRLREIINWHGLSDGGKMILVQALEWMNEDDDDVQIKNSIIQYFIDSSMHGSYRIKSAIRELEKKGFLARIRTRNLNTKKLGSSVWLFTDYIGGLEIAFQIAQETLDKKNIVILGEPHSKIDFSFFKENPKKQYISNSIIFTEAMEYKAELNID